MVATAACGEWVAQRKGTGTPTPHGTPTRRKGYARQAALERSNMHIDDGFRGLGAGKHPKNGLPQAGIGLRRRFERRKWRLEGLNSTLKQKPVPRKAPQMRKKTRFFAQKGGQRKNLSFVGACNQPQSVDKLCPTRQRFEGGHVRTNTL